MNIEELLKIQHLLQPIALKEKRERSTKKAKAEKTRYLKNKELKQQGVVV